MVSTRLRRTDYWNTPCAACVGGRPLVAPAARGNDSFPHCGPRSLGVDEDEKPLPPGTRIKDRKDGNMEKTPPGDQPHAAAPVTHVSGPDFLALQVRDLERATAFYQQEIGLKRAPTPEGVTGVVVFETSTIPFGLREPLPGTDLEAGPPGLGVSLSLHVDDAKALHTHLKSRSVPILMDPFDTPFGLTFVFQDPDGYVIAIHGAG
jgi:predicted enzyme related to lactoylglutathione lyase